MHTTRRERTMPSGRYRVVVNGFKVLAETWDDALEYDGKRDEVYITAHIGALDKNGQVLYKDEPTSPVMGDTSNLPGRVQAGTASTLGGLKTGDSYPPGTPWMQTVPL